MIPFGLALDERRPFRLLCLGAHADDIEIGAGGTILRLLDRFPGAAVRWAVFSGTAERQREARASAATFLAEAGKAEIILLDHRDGFLPWTGEAVKESMEALRRGFEPDLVLTHARTDRHQDHRLLGELSWNTFRDHLILEYEIPKWEGDLVTPQLYVPLPAVVARRKVAALIEHFGSQRNRDWFSEETFLALMRLRGIECRAPDGYAEGFHACKTLLLG